jgi:hypothetical protein
VRISHLVSITDNVGLFEHCQESQPRPEHGYCVDDVARGVVVLQRLGSKDPQVQRLTSIYLAFLEQSQDSQGLIRNRRNIDGLWQGDSSTHDHWGRALWAWGTTIRMSGDTDQGAAAYERFQLSARRRSPFVRSMAFAALGASEVLHALPGNSFATALLEDALAAIRTPTTTTWPWPEPRLTYANAVIPEVLMLGGFHLQRGAQMRLGMFMLNWLIETQMNGDHFSPIPHKGWAPGDALPAFDQQPIEIAALVDACSTAYDITSDPRWSRAIHMGYHWFEGHNDKGVAMADVTTGAGFDGLTQDGRNENSGAESTLAYLSVADRAKVFAGAPA